MRIFGTVWIFLALALLALACNGERCVGFDPQGRCIPAEKEPTDTTLPLPPVESGVISIPLAIITNSTIDIKTPSDICFCGDCGTVYQVRVENLEGRMNTDPGTPYGDFLDNARTMLEKDPSSIELISVDMSIGSDSVNVAAFEQLFTDYELLLRKSDDILGIGKGTGITGAAWSVKFSEEFDQPRQIPAWIDDMLSGDYHFYFVATTTGEHYSSNCGGTACPPECDSCPCIEFPKDFEMKISIDVRFRALQ